jgi:hypothetical protein
VAQSLPAIGATPLAKWVGWPATPFCPKESLEPPFFSKILDGMFFFKNFFFFFLNGLSFLVILFLMGH